MNVFNIKPSCLAGLWLVNTGIPGGIGTGGIAEGK
jgi:hypothetical protein